MARFPSDLEEIGKGGSKEEADETVMSTVFYPPLFPAVIAAHTTKTRRYPAASGLVR
jgi:hypothetical protein